MKKVKTILTATILSLITMMHFSCGKDGGGGSVFLPDLSATWANQANANNTFNFFGFTSNVSTSTYEGNEFSSGTLTGHFTGSFNNHNLNFIYDSGAKTGKSYSGTIDDASKTITLTSTTLASITLIK